MHSTNNQIKSFLIEDKNTNIIFINRSHLVPGEKKLLIPLGSWFMSHRSQEQLRAITSHGAHFDIMYQ